MPAKPPGEIAGSKVVALPIRKANPSATWGRRDPDTEMSIFELEDKARIAVRGSGRASHTRDLQLLRIFAGAPREKYTMI